MTRPHRPPPRGAPLRPGFSLPELIVALGMFSILLVTTLSFYDRQGDAFAEGNKRMTVMQNLRYGVNALEQNLRTAGVGVPAGQPVVVHAGKAVVTFNADYATHAADDFFAVYYDPRLPDDAVSALTPARRISFPDSRFTYPDSAYHVGEGNSPAETITFFFAPDSTTRRTDDYTLYRRVNDRPPEVVARHLLETGRPFFTYYVLRPTADGTPVTAIPATELPASHTVPIHGAPADTGRVALVDSIRAIRVSYAATNGLPAERETTRSITRLIRLPNAGLATPRNCGERPLLGAALVATPIRGTPSTAGRIRLEWTRAIDEASGEQDVLRYVVWRKDSAAAPWGDPLVSVAPGSSHYVYEDATARPDTDYWYALAAQDCTPQYSATVTTGPVHFEEVR